MTAICLLVGGILRATLPADEFRLRWQHSVAKTTWEERYRVERGQLALIEASVAGTGAGMEPPPDAAYADGTWRWHPRVAPLPELRITYSHFTRDYDVCWKSRCRALGPLIHARASSEVVSVRACEAKDSRDRFSLP